MKRFKNWVVNHPVETVTVVLCGVIFVQSFTIDRLGKQNKLLTQVIEDNFFKAIEAAVEEDNLTRDDIA